MPVDRGAPRVMIVAAPGPLRDDLQTLLAGLSPVAVSPRARELSDVHAAHSTVRAVLVVEHEAEPAALDVVQAIKASDERIAVFVLSDQPTIDHATEAIRRGAEDFVPIPFSDDLLRKEVDRALEAADLREGLSQLQTFVSSAHGIQGVVAGSALMRAALERAQAGARSDIPVLIVGETGTGKELLARAIHASGARRDRPFVPINCAALPHDLIESELFGHRRGAFSGALRDHPGLFVAAHRGTLMLDEIGELPGPAQAKLLRVLQDGDVRAVGGLDSSTVDVRVIASTNRTVHELRAGALRQDLFFRLSVLVIDVPPLRERTEDIPRLIRHFLSSYGGGGAPRTVAPEALALLTHYRFPGNVRELENLVHNLSVTLPLDRSEILADDVRGWFRRQGATLEPPTAEPRTDEPLNLRQLEAHALRRALDEAAGNKSKAAQLLGISRDSLYRKMRECGVRLSENKTGNLNH